MRADVLKFRMLSFIHTSTEILDMLHEYSFRVGEDLNQKHLVIKPKLVTKSSS